MSSRPLAMQFPMYQIDFSAVAAGKRVAATKRRIRWYVLLLLLLEFLYCMYGGV